MKSIPIIGIRTASWANFTHGIYHGILQFIREHGPWQLRRTVVDSTNELEPVRINRHWRGDGLILFRATAAEIAQFRERRIAVVCISTESAVHGVPIVIPDNVACGRIAARHLLGLGLQHFAYWGDQTRRYSRERGKGFAEQLRESGHECHQIGVEASRLANRADRWKRIRLAMVPQLQALPKPIGVLAKDDIAAAALIETCQRLGYSVPADVAVVGVNNDEIFCHTTVPPLTSVPYPGEIIGYQAAVMLDALMHGRGASVPLETIIPVSGIAVRESTDVVQVKDSVIAEALQRIRREALRYPLQVNELVTASPLSRAAFKRRFALAIGQSPKSEIKRVRLDFLQDLLRSTDWPIKRIAEHMRFESIEELGRFMRRETGLTATAFRALCRKHRPLHEVANLPDEEA